MTSKTSQELLAELGDEPHVKIRPLSFAQEQLWFLDQLAPDQTAYNVLMVYRLRGPLRADLLQQCVSLVVARHESLRVTIGSHEGTPFQAVAPVPHARLSVTDLRALPEAEREQRVQAEIKAQSTEPYDLETGPLCRFRLFQLDADEFVFCQGFHHIVTDGWSITVLNAELSAAYHSLSAGKEPHFGELMLDYTRFAESQRERLSGEVLTEELSFWRRLLADLPVLELPADRPRPVGGHRSGETLVRDFPEDLRGIVKQLADDHGASMFMVLAAACNLVLSRYGGLEDIPTGVPMLGRPEAELEAVVGMFINMVVLRSDLSGDPTFSELIERIADSVLDLYDHQELPFNQVVDAVQPVRDPDRNPLFQVSLQLQGESNSGENLRFPGVVSEFVPLPSVSARFDIGINLVDSGTALRATVEYSTEMFDRWRIAAMLTHLETVLRAASADPGRRLSQIPIVAGAEAEQLLSAGRGEQGEWPTLPLTGSQTAATQIYVVDPSMNLLPRGVAGALLIGCEADDLGEGHLDQPELSLARLADDPFAAGRKVYRTGDLARWSPELRLELLGRADDVVSQPGSVDLEPRADSDDEPQTATEQSVAGIFCEVLTLPGVSAEESFFDVGGNSLQAMRAVSRINKAFAIKLSVRTLYGNATVRAISAAVDEKAAASPPDGERA